MKKSQKSFTLVTIARQNESYTFHHFKMILRQCLLKGNTFRQLQFPTFFVLVIL